MMELFFVIFTCGYLFLTGYCFYKSADSDNGLPWGVSCFILVVILFWVILLNDKSLKEKGPCAQYETQMHFNAATKTMMPAKVCVLRGEWIKETD